MKYSTLPFIVTVLGFAFMGVTSYLALGLNSEIKAMAVIGFGMAFFALCSGFATDAMLGHHKRLLQRHGLWDDQIIRKSKPADSKSDES